MGGSSLTEIIKGLARAPLPGRRQVRLVVGRRPADGRLEFAAERAPTGDW